MPLEPDREALHRRAEQAGGSGIVIIDPVGRDERGHQHAASGDHHRSQSTARHPRCCSPTPAMDKSTGISRMRLVHLRLITGAVRPEN